MKKKTALIFILMFTLAFTLLMTGCGSSPSNLEEYIAQNEDALSSLQNASEEGMAVTAEGNNLVYTYDLSKVDSYTEDIATNEVTISALESALDGGASTFQNIAKVLEDQTEIDGIQVVVKYNWKDQVLVEKTFTSGE